jgi:hypothetical protein
MYPVIVCNMNIPKHHEKQYEWYRKLSSHNLSVLIYLSNIALIRRTSTSVSTLPGLTGRVDANIQNHECSNGSGFNVAVYT